MSIDRTQMFRCLAELDLGEGSWVVAGSGPLLAHRIISSIADLDIVVDARAWRQASGHAEADARVGLHGDRLLGFSLDGVPVEIFDGWHGAAASAVIDRSDTMEGYRFLSLSEVATFKRTLDRPKDRIHLALLERHLARVDPPMVD